MLARSRGNDGFHETWFIKDPEVGPTFHELVFVYPTTEAARFAYSRSKAAFDCVTWTDEDDDEHKTADLARPTLGDAAFAKRWTITTGSGFCNSGDTARISDLIYILRGKFLIYLKIDAYSRYDGCDLVTPAPLPDTAELNRIGKNAITRIDQALKRYTVKFYKESVQEPSTP